MQNPRFDDYPHGITAIDTDYVRPYLDASHLVVRDGRAAFVDTGTTHSVPHLLATLERKGIAREQVDYVLVTHVHLDHAGGAGALMQALPNARLVVHPRGARHMAQPAKLIEGTIAVYGEAQFRQLYGEIPAVDPGRIVEIGDDETLALGNSRLRFIHTAGHAAHHYCIVDEDADSIFAGDTFGIAYRELAGNRGEFIFVTSTPVQFDPAALHASIDRLMRYQPSAIFLTHYSRVTELPRLAQDLHADVDAYVAMALAARSAADPQQAIAEAMRAHLTGRLQAHGSTWSADAIAQFLAADIALNSQGLAVWLARQ